MRLKYIFVCTLPWLMVTVISDNAGVDSMCDYNNETHVMNCSKRNISYVPQDPTGRTVLLNMTHNKLYIINGSAFQTYTKLQVLDLSFTKLCNLSTDTFDGLSSLKSLNLSMNWHLPFTKNNFPEHIFESLTALEELKVFCTTEDFSNQGEGYPGTALAKLPSLRTVWLDGLSNASFDVAFKNMTSLDTLYLAGDRNFIWGYCHMPRVSHAMLENLIHVVNFWVRACGVKFITSDAFSSMVKLKWLDLSSNFLLSLNGVTAACEGLSKTPIEKLFINSVSTLIRGCNASISSHSAKDLGKLKSLKELHVEENKISGFERGAIANLPKSLEYVNIKKNAFQMGWYAFEIFYLVNLEKVDLSYNLFVDRTSLWSSDHLTNDVCEEHQHINSMNLQSDNNTRLSCHDNTVIKENAGHTHYSVVGKDFAHAFNNLLSRSFSSEYDAGPSKQESDVEDHLSDAKVCTQPMILLPPKCITAFLPKNVKHIDISHSKLAHPIPELYFDEDNTVKSINASHSLLFCWDGPVHGLKNLEHLDLSTNLCSKIRMSFFDPLPNLKNLSIADNLLAETIQHDKTGRLFKNLANLEVLDMSRNQIETIPHRFLVHQINLKSLILSYNSLIAFEIQVDQFVRLRSLNLRHNSVTTLSKSIRDNLTRISDDGKHTKAVNLNLIDNNLQCYCNNREFLSWVKEHMYTCQFLNITISRCIDDQNKKVRVTNRTELEKVIQYLENECNTYTTLIVISGVAFCVLVSSFVSVVAYRFRWKMTYWYFVKSRDKSNSGSGYVSIENLGSSSSRFKFDLYVSSVENTRHFVLENLKQILEGNNYRVFLQDDDIIPGQNIYCMIGNAIHLSRMVIFIVSEMCEENKEWRIAMRMAHEESLNRGYPIFFGVFVGHHPDRYDSKDIREIKRRPYLTYPDNTQPINEQTFWHDLVQNVKELGGIHVLSMSEDPTIEVA